MVRKLLTAEALKALDGISAEDKELIEVEVIDEGGGRDEGQDIPLRQAIRGFLTQQFLDFEPDEELRSSLDGDAAAFVDGWAWCNEHGQ